VRRDGVLTGTAAVARAAALLATAATAAHPASPGLPRFGVAVQLGTELLCAAGLGSAPPETPVTLVDPAPPQSWLAARVVPAAADRDCARLGEYLLTPPYLALDHRGPAAEPGTLFVVVAGEAACSLADGAVELRLPAIAQALRFRVCASLEGAHLTVWQGEPRAGNRLWHEYAYLGYDTEATCSEADHAP
jgi:hypothetical protein